MSFLRRVGQISLLSRSANVVDIVRQRRLSCRGSASADAIISQFEAAVGAKQVSTAEAVCRQHGQDEGPADGEAPWLTTFPTDVQHVVEVVKLCAAHGLPIVPFGTGTGLENGVSACRTPSVESTAGPVCVDLSQMAAIVDYHPTDFDVAVQPGVTREALNHHVKDDGLWFPVDPGANASICGMCATSASGTNAVRYGTMKENCLNLQVVLPDGEVIETAGRAMRARKSAAGYDLTHLFLGSEGTLGIITRATVRLHAQPTAVAAAVVAFPDVASAVATVVSVLQCAVPVARMELLDDLAIKACNEYSAMDLSVRPTLFFEFHANEDDELKAQTETVRELATDNSGSDFQWAINQEDRNRLWTARHKLYYACLALRPGCRSVTTDVCVPISALPDVLAATRADIDASGLVGPMLGHVGDGNFHAFLLFGNPDELATCKAVAARMAERALAAGGTCTGEHGIGLGKRQLLEIQFGRRATDLMRTLKRAVDPNGIMNPHKILLSQP